MVRFKNRYIIAEITLKTPVSKYSNHKISEKAIHSAICDKIQDLYGDFGFAAVINGLVVRKWNERLRTVLIRARHGPHKFVTSCLPLINKVSEEEIGFHSLYMSGTMRCCYKFVIKYYRKKAFEELADIRGTQQYDEMFKVFTKVKNIAL